jgi:hypothetical protein
MPPRRSPSPQADIDESNATFGTRGSDPGEVLFRQAHQPRRWILAAHAGAGAAVAAVAVHAAAGPAAASWRAAHASGRARQLRWISYLTAGAAAAAGGLASLIWVALKVGALSYGVGFVIIPLMQADAVSHYQCGVIEPVGRANAGKSS